MADHVYEKCTRKACTKRCPEAEFFGIHLEGCEHHHCSGCHPDSGMDCRYEALSFCRVCGGMEGSLLPFCPERRLSMDEDAANYRHYCAGTGPFAKPSFNNLTEAKDACYERQLSTKSYGSMLLYQAIWHLWNFTPAGPLDR